jgi:bifunctional aspartokinase / homoserine dehydrogenase 1
MKPRIVKPVALCTDTHCALLHTVLSCFIHTHTHRAMGAGLKEYHALLAARRSGEASYQYETTVGGGLPVLLTLQNAQSSGDAPVVVEGVISAFLSRVFNAVSPAAAAFSNSASSSSDSSSSNSSSEGMLFSEACALAAAEGLVDAQNPLQQLCCLDVSRRLLILGRELGLQLDTDSVAVEPVLPAQSCSDNGSSSSSSNSSSNSSTDIRDSRSSSSSSGAHSLLPDGSLPPQLLAVLQQQDAHFAQAAAAARSRGAALRYIARVDVSSCSATAGLVEVPFSDPMAQLTGAAYCVRYVSSESSSSGCQRAPVVLQGPVGGAATIASALFSDVIRVARDLGARDRGHLMKSVPSFAIKHSVAN